MTLMRRGPQRSLTPFGDVFDLLSEDPWETFNRWTRQAAGTAPSIDVRETDEAYVVKAELPGVKPEDADITLEGQTLVIRGRYGDEQEDEREGGRWLVRERRSGSYARAITLPGAIDAENITSTFENGELRLTLPKAQETRARRIPIGRAEDARQVGTGEGRSTEGRSDWRGQGEGGAEGGPTG